MAEGPSPKRLKGGEAEQGPSASERPSEATSAEKTPKGKYLASLVETLLFQHASKIREQNICKIHDRTMRAKPDDVSKAKCRDAKQMCWALNESMSNIKKHLIRVGASDKWLDEVASLSPSERCDFDILNNDIMGCD